jgi:hypothetical protein
MCWEYGWTNLVSTLYDGSCLTLKYQACTIKIIMDKHFSLFGRSNRSREKKFYSMGDSRDKITKIEGNNFEGKEPNVLTKIELFQRGIICGSTFVSFVSKLFC